MPLFKKKSDKKQPVSKTPQHPPNATFPPQHIPPPLSSAPSPSSTSKPPLQSLAAQRKPVETGTRLPNGGAIAQIRNDDANCGKDASLQREFSDEDSKYGDLGTGAKQLANSELETRSRLCRTLPDILHDNGALPYFIQFMQEHNAAHLVQFWLATESFATASWSRLRSESLTSASKSLAGQKPRGDSATGEPPLPTVDCHLGVAQNISEPRENSTVVDSDNERLGLSTSEGAGVRTHSRAKSDSLVGNVGNLQQDGVQTEPGHRRNNSWKGVDPRTAVERDASNIFTRYLCKDAVLPVGISDEVRLGVIAKMCPKEGWLNPDCFKTAQNYVFETMEKHFSQAFLRSDFHCKYQIDILTTGKAYLADILFNDTATFYLMEYMEQEDAVNLLQFWLAAENFQKHLLSQQGQYDSAEAQSDAMVLYDQYFSLQATCPIGFDDSMRLEVEANICREGGPLPDCFATPMRQAYTTLETVYFPGFLQSELYYRFLSELINTIKSEHAPLSLNHGDPNPPVSDPACAVAHAGEPKSRNTLLAEGNIKKLFDESQINMDGLDSNPDLLWQRLDPGMMTFGKVNHLGQFVAEYEPEPEAINKKMSVSKFSFKKLVKGDPDVTKEEMALKIAQMIINDVNLQTGTSTPPPSPSIRPALASTNQSPSNRPTQSSANQREATPAHRSTHPAISRVKFIEPSS